MVITRVPKRKSGATAPERRAVKPGTPAGRHARVTSPHRRNVNALRISHLAHTTRLAWRLPPAPRWVERFTVGCKKFHQKGVRMQRWIASVVGSLLIVLGCFTVSQAQSTTLVGGGLTALPSISLGP